MSAGWFSPNRTGQNRTSPKRTGPKRTGQNQTGPNRTGPNQTEPVRTGSIRTGPNRTGSVQSGPVGTGAIRNGPCGDGLKRFKAERCGPTRGANRGLRCGKGTPARGTEAGDFDGEDLGRAGEGGDEHGGALLHEEILATEKEASCGEWVGAGLGAHEALEEGAQAGVGPESTGQPL